MGAGTRERVNDLSRRTRISLPLVVFVVAVSMVPILQFPSWPWAVALASLPVVTWAAWPFHRAALSAARHASTTMDTLVSLGVIATSLWSWWALVFGGASTQATHMGMSLLPTLPPFLGGEEATNGHPVGIYFEGACTIVLFLLLGRRMEARARHSAGDALRALLEMGADEATRIRIDPHTGRGTEERVPIEKLQVGDLFRVRPGEKIPTDGIVVEGDSAVDASLLTGESLPLDVTSGSTVTGATINTWGSLVVQATTVGADTALARIGRLVTETQSGKAPVQRLADRISAVFVPIVLAISTLTLTVWLLLGADLQPALSAAVAVLVVACPCALGLATPTALLVGSSRAAQKGILITAPDVLEQSQHLDTMLLDKTGTITSGRMALESLTVAEGAAHSEALALAAGADLLSEHPVARAIVAGAAERGCEVAELHAFCAHAGMGVSAVDDASGLVLLGRPSWLSALGVRIDPSLTAHIHSAESTGASAVLLALVPHWEDTPRVSNTDKETVRQTSQTDTPPVALVDMQIRGMTCAACVRRVERKLSKVDGVSASVNLATETALVTLRRNIDDTELEGLVRAAGYEGVVINRKKPPACDEETAAATGHETSGARILPERLDGAYAVALFVVRDTVKAHSPDAISQIRQLGITPILLTGDNRHAAHHVAQAVGIDTVIAEVFPEDKARIVGELQDRGKIVAMVGDGVNDAAALARAGNRGLGIAMGSGTDVARHVADIILVNSELTAAAAAVRISRATLRIIKQNLFWAFAYNVAMIPLAFLGMLNPMIASGAMAFSSVFVVVNSLRLRRAD